MFAAAMSLFTKAAPAKGTNLPPHVSFLRRGALACANVPKVGVFIFFQDFDGFIRETQYIFANKAYRGGDKASRIMIADDMKYHGPLAAVQSNNSDALVRYYCL